MKYEIRLSAPRGDIVPLLAVASTKARVAATAGGTPFHRPTYRGSLKGFVSDILNEARSGRLNVCNVWGSPGGAEELIAEAERTGSLVSATRFAKNPDWDRILEENEPIAPGLWDLSALDLGSTVPDLDTTHISALYATLKSLNDWGSSRGDEFSVTHEGVEWIDERGVMGRTAPHAPPDSLLLRSAPGATHAPDQPESKEDRQDRRLRACEAAGLVMPASPHGRLPNGTGKVAANEGVSRQAFSDDVREALERRAARIREGATPPRAT